MHKHTNTHRPATRAHKCMSCTHAHGYARSHSCIPLYVHTLIWICHSHTQHTRARTHMHKHTHKHAQTCDRVHIINAVCNARMHLCTHICIRTTQCTHACIHAYIYKCMHACARFCFACVRVLHVRIYHFSSSRVLLIMCRRTAQHGKAESSNDKRAPRRHDPPSTRWLG